MISKFKNRIVNESSIMATPSDKQVTDCYWFLQGKCTKGDSCEYRHSQAALENLTVCKNWIAGTCSNVDCKFRHPSGASANAVQPCKYFAAGNCMRGSSCAFVHVPSTSARAHEEAELKALREERLKEEQRLQKLKAETQALSSATHEDRMNQPLSSGGKRKSKETSGPGIFSKSIEGIKDDRPQKAPRTPKSAIESKPKSDARPRPDAKSRDTRSDPAPSKLPRQATPKKQELPKKQSSPSAKVMDFGIKSLAQLQEEEKSQASAPAASTPSASASPSASVSKPLPAKAPIAKEDAKAQEMKQMRAQRFGTPSIKTDIKPAAPSPTASAMSPTSQRKAEDIDAEIESLISGAGDLNDADLEGADVDIDELLGE